MKCKEAGIDLCDACSYFPNNSIYDCWIEYFQRRYSSSIDYRRYLMVDMKLNNNRYLKFALKSYHPEWYEWYQKMLILK